MIHKEKVTFSSLYLILTSGFGEFIFFFAFRRYILSSFNLVFLDILTRLGIFSPLFGDAFLSSCFPKLNLTTPFSIFSSNDALLIHLASSHFTRLFRCPSTNDLCIDKVLSVEEKHNAGTGPSNFFSVWFRYAMEVRKRVNPASWNIEELETLGSNNNKEPLHTGDNDIPNQISLMENEKWIENIGVLTIQGKPRNK